MKFKLQFYSNYIMNYVCKKNESAKSMYSNRNFEIISQYINLYSYTSLMYSFITYLRLWNLLQHLLKYFISLPIARDMIGTSSGAVTIQESALSPSPLLSRDEKNSRTPGLNRLCHKCHLRQATKYYMPCGLHTTCDQCEQQPGTFCPVCSRLITNTIRVFTAWVNFSRSVFLSKLSCALPA